MVFECFIQELQILLHGNFLPCHSGCVSLRLPDACASLSGPPYPACSD
jgi:hypothetical protein